jgi:hypothetical protein
LAPLLLWLWAGGWFTDRYLLPFLAAAVAAAAALPARRLAWVGLAAVGLFSAAGTFDMLQWNGAFWRGARGLASLGVAEAQINGTLAWTAEHNYQAAMDELKKERPLSRIADKEWFLRFQEKRRGVVTFSKDLPRQLFAPAGQVDYWCPWTLRYEAVRLYVAAK